MKTNDLRRVRGTYTMTRDLIFRKLDSHMSAPNFDPHAAARIIRDASDDMDEDDLRRMHRDLAGALLRRGVVARLPVSIWYEGGNDAEEVAGAEEVTGDEHVLLWCLHCDPRTYIDGVIFEALPEGM